MTQMTTPKQLFEHELQDVYYAEKTIEKMLPKLASEATTRDLSRAFEAHLIETKEQIKNLERVFSKLGKSAKGEACPGIEGLKAEHDKFMQEESPTNDVRDHLPDRRRSADRALRDRGLHRPDLHGSEAR